VVNIWNSLPDSVVVPSFVDFIFDQFWFYQDGKYDYKAQLTGIDDISEFVNE